VRERVVHPGCSQPSALIEPKTSAASATRMTSRRVRRISRNVISEKGQTVCGTPSRDGLRAILTLEFFIETDDRCCEALSWLRRENARGSDILFRPCGVHTFSLVYDLGRLRRSFEWPAEDFSPSSSSRPTRELWEWSTTDEYLSDHTFSI